MALATSSFTMIAGLFEVVEVSLVLLAIFIGGLFCIIIASSISELASLYPSSPGIRTYIKAAWGDRLSLIFVFMYLIFLVLIGGVESYVFVLVIKSLFPAITPSVVVLILLLIIIGVNILGFELSKNMQILTTTILVSSILTMGVYGFWDSQIQFKDIIHNFNALSSNFESLPAAIGMAIFLFIGFEWITPLGVTPESYKKRVPWSMIFAVIFNIGMYSLFVIGLHSQVSTKDIIAQSIPQVPYALKILGPNGIILAALLSILAIISTLNAGVLGGSRLIYALTREGNLPSWCAKINLRSGVPTVAILMLGGSVIISSQFIIYYELELPVSIVGSSIICMVYLVLMASMLKLRKLEPNLKRPFKNRVYKWLQWIVIALLPLIGLGALLSQPQIKYQLFLGFVSIIIMAIFISSWCIRKKMQSRLKN